LQPIHNACGVNRTDFITPSNATNAATGQVISLFTSTLPVKHVTPAVVERT
jgi:hypothetical protein